MREVIITLHVITTFSGGTSTTGNDNCLHGIAIKIFRLPIETLLKARREHMNFSTSQLRLLTRRLIGFNKARLGHRVFYCLLFCQVTKFDLCITIRLK